MKRLKGSAWIALFLSAQAFIATSIASAACTTDTNPPVVTLTANSSNSGAKTQTQTYQIGYFNPAALDTFQASYGSVSPPSYVPSSGTTAADVASYFASFYNGHANAYSCSGGPTTSSATASGSSFTVVHNICHGQGVLSVYRSMSTCPTCTGGRVLDTSTSTCNCPSGQTWDGTNCTSPATPTPGNLVFSPNSGSFGDVTIGATSTKSVTITNNTATPLASCWVSSSDTTNFTVLGSTGCLNLAAGGGTCTFTYQGNPTIGGTLSSTLTLNCGGATPTPSPIPATPTPTAVPPTPTPCNSTATCENSMTQCWMGQSTYTCPAGSSSPGFNYYGIVDCGCPGQYKYPQGMCGLMCPL